MINEDSIKLAGRIISLSFYEMQQLRISTINRIRDIIRKKNEGISFDKVEEKKDKKKREKKYTDEELKDLLKKVLDKGDITQKEYDYLLRCFDLSKESIKLENKYKKAMEDYVLTEDIYRLFLSKIRGIGPILSANLMKEFEYCEKYDNVAKLWAHSGNHVNEGVAPKKRKGEDLTFSPRLRTMTWKISDCLMKLNHGFYRQIYITEKEKQLKTEYKEGELFKKYGKPYKKEDINLRKLHAHNRALRKIRKLFLSHYWACARELAGLDVRLPYVEEKLGHQKIITWRQAVKMEK